MTTKSLMEGLDSLCRQKVFTRDGTCLICEALGRQPKSGLQPAHVESRSYKSLRWYLFNIVTICKNHHMYGAHVNKALTEDIFKAWFAAKYPERYKLIQERKRWGFDLSVETLLKIKRELENA